MYPALPILHPQLMIGSLLTDGADPEVSVNGRIENILVRTSRTCCEYSAEINNEINRLLQCEVSLIVGQEWDVSMVGCRSRITILP